MQERLKGAGRPGILPTVDDENRDVAERAALASELRGIQLLQGPVFAAQQPPAVRRHPRYARVRWRSFEHPDSCRRTLCLPAQVRALQPQLRVVGVLLQGSRYAERLPIGLRETLWVGAVGATLAAADLFLLSKEDADVLCGGLRPEEVLDWCHHQGTRWVVLKLGAEGAIASDGARRWRVASYKVDAVDATGAGDCFAGAAMARLAAGDGIEAALDYASAAAALTCTGFGAVEPLPRHEAVRALMAG